jgi:hypothetical protein
VIASNVAKRAGLARQAGDEIVGDTAIGPLRLEQWHFMSGPRIQANGTALGRDILGSYRMQVIPGKELRLRPRRGAWESAEERIARWPWAHGCGPSGCVRGRVETREQAARLLVSFDFDYPRAVEFLLGWSRPRSSREGCTR